MSNTGVTMTGEEHLELNIHWGTDNKFHQQVYVILSI